MTNADIIFAESQKLAEQGKIAYTGREMLVTYADGTQGVIKETEPIHTFAEWKKGGYIVKKGQHAVAQFPIWNYTNKPSRRTQAQRELAGQDVNAEDPHYYMKISSFFSQSQVELLQAEA